MIFTLPITLLTDTSGNLRTTGIGMRNSFLFLLDRRRPDIFIHGLTPLVSVVDYAGNHLQAAEATRKACQDGAALVIGPCDSAAVHEIILRGSAGTCPIISPLATGTGLTSLGARNFFRMTSPDRMRVELLIRSLLEIYANRRIFVYAFSDTEWSYAQLLKNDVISALEKRGATWHCENFSTSGIPSKLPKAREPIVCCGPSVQIVRLVRDLRVKGVRSQIFTFGSNSNLLITELRNAITVADVDPEDANPITAKEAEEFEATFGHGVSIATLNCAAILANLFCRRAKEIQSTTHVTQLHDLIATDLKSLPQEGLLGRFMFSADGEMSGAEQLVVLRVSLRLGALQFRHLSLRRKAKPLPRVRWVALLAWLFGLGSFLVAIIQAYKWLK